MSEIGATKSPEPVTNHINDQIIRLFDRQQGAIDQLEALKERMFGRTPKADENPTPDKDEQGPGTIAAIDRHLAEAHRRMGVIEQLIDDLSQL